MYNLGIWIARLRISHFRATRATPIRSLCVMAAYNCSDPPSLSKGYFVIAKPYYVDGDRVFYYCQWTYFLQGNPIRECDGDTGNWTGSAPTCSTITTTTTTTTEAPVNGLISCMKYWFGFLWVVKKNHDFTKLFFFTKPEWIYMSISLSSFLALVFVCIVGVVILKYCYILCR